MCGKNCTVYFFAITLNRSSSLIIFDARSLSFNKFPLASVFHIQFMRKRVYRALICHDFVKKKDKYIFKNFYKCKE